MAGLYKLLKCIDFFALCVATISFSLCFFVFSVIWSTDLFEFLFLEPSPLIYVEYFCTGGELSLASSQ